MTGVLIDTSAAFALLDATDPEHDIAVAWLKGYGDERLVTHVGIVIECTALFDQRLGTGATRDFLDGLLPTIAVFHGTELTYERALAAYRMGMGKRRPSLVDFLAFETMRELELDAAFTFDTHFRDAGLAVVPGD